MKKKRFIFTAACMILLCIAAAFFLFSMGKKPYKNLEAAQILSARVFLLP